MAGAFIQRISKIAEQTDEGMIEEPDGWMFGPNRRDVGSLQIDQLTCAASDLARRNLIAVHPVTGWWKAKSIPDPQNLHARFALVIEIDAGTAPVDHYAEVQAAIANMAATVVRADVVADAIDADDMTASVADDLAGAVVTFCGVVRRRDHGADVNGLDYTSHPDAPRVISEIAERFTKLDGVHRVALSHRVGHLDVGEVALVVAVAAEHRGQAFDAYRTLIERVKSEVPIWKHQLFTDGSEEWVGVP